MMGLIYKNLKMGHGVFTLWNIVLLTIGMAILGLIIPWEMFFVYIPFGLTGGIGALTLGNMYKDDDSNWQKLEAIMPFTSRQVIFSKYASYAILLAPLCMMIFAYGVTNYLSGTLLDACDCYYCVCTGICECVLYMVQSSFSGVITFFFMMGALMMPLHFFMTPTKNEIAFVSGMFITVVLLVFLVGIMAVFNFSTIVNFILRVGCAVAFYVGSYFLSLRIYRKKSF